MMNSTAKYAIALIIFSSIAFAQPRKCSGQGNLHLVYPLFTIYCKVGNQIEWGIEYNPNWKALVVLNSRSGKVWDLALHENAAYGDNAYTIQSGVKTKESFKLNTGPRQGDWISVSFTGID